MPATSSLLMHHDHVLLRRIHSVASVFLGFFAASLGAATVGSPPLGGTTIAVPASTETLLSVPFQRPVAFVGRVQSASGDSIAVADNPGWVDNRWAYAAATQRESYYVQVASGAKDGAACTIKANAPASLTVELEGGSLTGLAAGDLVKIIPHWTLGTLFPATAAGTMFAVTFDPAAPATTVHLTDPRAAGINQPATAYYFHANAWRQVGGDPAVDRSDVIVRSDVPVRIRQQSAGGTLAIAGGVALGRQVLALRTAALAPQDNPVALRWPLPVALNQLGLTTGGAFSSSTNVAARTDLLLVFNNAPTAPHRPAADYYFHHNGAWRKLGQPLTQDFGGDTVFGPNRSVVVRKAPSAGGAPVSWTHTPQ